MTEGTILVGVISDTHGLLRPQVHPAFAGVQQIVHAGDVGAPEILPELRTIAPVVAVRGNVDQAAWARPLRRTEVITVGAVTLYVLRDVTRLDLDPAASGFAAVICGHTHQPLIRRNGGVLYVNPGSAGPRRFQRPVSVALLRITARHVEAELISLDV